MARIAHDGKCTHGTIAIKVESVVLFLAFSFRREIHEGEIVTAVFVVGVLGGVVLINNCQCCKCPVVSRV